MHPLRDGDVERYGRYPHWVTATAGRRRHLRRVLRAAPNAAPAGRCGDTTTRSTSALGHNMRTSYYSATCTSGGYTYHYCSRCSYSYTSNQTSALGHNWGSYTTTKSQRVRKRGTETATCSRCSATTSRTLSALGHDYGDYIVTIAPGCTTAGEETSTCSRCQATQTRSVDALGHSPVTDAAVPAACTVAGLTEGSHCSRCNTVLEAQETVPALGHDYGSYVTTTPPTCTATGHRDGDVHALRCGDVADSRGARARSCRARGQSADVYGDRLGGLRDVQPL